MLRIALLGCGKIAQKYIHCLTTGEDRLAAEIVAICDVNDQRARNLSSKHNIPFYQNLNHMMEAEISKIDLVAVLTPSGLHAKNVISLAQYKKHILVEKPMALTLTDADAMIEACHREGIKLFVVKQNRYNRPIKKLREAVEQNRFGKMVMGTVRVRWCRKQTYYDQASWRGTWKQDGGVFINQAIHHIDLLQWMMGPVESVYAKSVTRLMNIETEDTGVAVLKFSSGALGVIEATTASRPKDLEGSLSILGEKGSVEIGGFFANEIKTWNFVDQTEEQYQSVMQNYRTNPQDVYAFPHQEYIADIIKNIAQDNNEFLVDGITGKKSLELVSAIYESIETSKEVYINYPLKKYRSNTVPFEL